MNRKIVYIFMSLALLVGCVSGEEEEITVEEAELSGGRAFSEVVNSARIEGFTYDGGKYKEIRVINGTPLEKYVHNSASLCRAATYFGTKPTITKVKVIRRLDIISLTLSAYLNRYELGDWCTLRADGRGLRSVGQRISKYEKIKAWIRNISPDALADLRFVVEVDVDHAYCNQLRTEAERNECKRL